MFGPARLSPYSRGVLGLGARGATDGVRGMGNADAGHFAVVVGEELWAQHWRNHEAILQLMRDAEATVNLIREKVAASSSTLEPTPLAASE